jgi:hypothetical protein
MQELAGHLKTNAKLEQDTMEGCDSDEWGSDDD